MKTQHLISAAFLLAATLFAAPAPAKELIAEFEGERSKWTGEFEVDAPWILDWRVTGELAEEMAVDASLVEAETNVHQGNVLKARAPGNGVRLFKQGGRYFFQVSSTFAGWHFRVYALTPEEAELYTPKNPSPLDY